MTDDNAVLMQQMVSLDYRVLASPVQQRFDERMLEGQLTGHGCPSCGRVYVPPKGYCPLCVVETTREHEVDVADQGTVVSFTILTPIQYRGQKERQPYALASLLLDGADSTVGQQRIAGVALDDIRMGMRVKAEWNPPEQRTRDASAMAQWSIGKGVKQWVPSGEPDAPREQYQEHIL
jgi:uncharacterized OB-fold protein